MTTARVEVNIACHRPVRRARNPSPHVRGPPQDTGLATSPPTASERTFMNEKTYDLIIRGGLIVDGAGNPWFPGNIAVRAGRIAAIGLLRGATAHQELEVSGRFVTPGFVDVHAHSDFSLTINRGAESQIAQGITTEVIGNCGFSAYPRLPETHRLMFDPEGVDGDWSSPPEYFATLGASPVGDNVVSLLGHSTIRHAAMGANDRPPTTAELDRMKSLVREAMSAGAAGISTGLDYVPGRYAQTDELVELCRVVAEYGGVYASHLRGYTDTLIEAVAEAITLGEHTGVGIQLSHMDVFGRSNWGKARRVVEMVNEARARGIDVTADMMAYPTAGAWWAPRALFPEDAYAWQLPAEEALLLLQQQLQEPERRQELRALVERRRTQDKKGFHEELLIFSDWENIYLDGVSDRSRNAKWVGRSIAAIASETGRDAVDMYFDLVVDEGPELSSTHIAINEDDYRMFCSQPWMMFGTDSIATSLERNRDPFNIIQAHPRHYANFVRVLSHHVRDRGWLTLEDGVRKMSSLPARRFRISDRGLIAVGLAADLVVVDLDRLAEVADWLHPRRYPTGLDYVIVNGSVEVDHGTFTGALAGRPLLMADGAVA